MTVINIDIGEKLKDDAIYLGREGEYNVTQVVFDMCDIAADVGDGTAALVHYPYNGEPYIVPVAGETYDAVRQEGMKVTWTIGQLATMHRGHGTVMVNWCTKSGLKKSRKFVTKVLPGVGNADSVTNVQQTYIDQMAALAAGIQDSIEAGAGVISNIEDVADNAIGRVHDALSDADAKIGDIESAVCAVDEKIEDINTAGAEAVEAARVAARVTVKNECLVYGGE